MLTRTRSASGVNLASASIASLCRIWPTPSRRSATARAVAAAGLFSWWVKPGGDGAQRQQLLALTDDLALPQAADLVPLEQMHGHRELGLHELRERVGVQHEAARRFGHPDRRLVDVLLAGHVRRPGAEVDAALRRPVRSGCRRRRSAWT